MPRLFVAIALPTPLANQLSALSARIDGVRWTETANLHLTLRFIGDVPQETAVSIQATLSTIQSLSFTLQLTGVGTFPANPRKPPRIVWVGLSQPPELHSLYEMIESRLRSLALPPDDKPYAPHITLARVRSPDSHTASAVHRFIEHNAGYQSKPLPVTEFHLMESRLTPAGPVYTSLASYPMTDT